MRQLLALFVLLLPVLSWAGVFQCADHSSVQVYQNDVAQVQQFSPEHARTSPQPDASIFFRSSEPDLPAWEFFEGETLDIVELVSAPEWSHISVDELSCRLPFQNEPSTMSSVCDPHEIALTIPDVALELPLTDAAAAVSQQPLRSVPVLPADKPPRRTA